MPDDIDLENLEKEIDQTNKVEKRIKDLSEKVRLTSEERDETKRLSEEKDSKIKSLETERDFLSSFGEQTQKHPDAVAFRDNIKERVLKGYSVEDATVSVLNEQGKLFKENKVIDKVPPENTVGGSSMTPPPQTSDKKITDMSRDEKRQALVEAEKRGDIGMS